MKLKKLQFDYFCNPENRFLNKIKISKIQFENIELYSEKPCVFISPRISPIDKTLITKCIKTPFVFFKDEIIQKIDNGTLSKTEEVKLFDEIEKLKKLGYSFSLIWNDEPSTFGINKPLSDNLIDFLVKLNLEIKFLNFPNEYFVYPVWAKEKRNAIIYASQKLKIKPHMLRGLTEKETKKIFDNSTQSTASSYFARYPLDLKSNNLAVGLEQVFYCCPTCKKLLSLYSEFSCIKCKNCGSAFELSNNGNFLFSNEIYKIEDIEKFQFSILSKKDFDINEIIAYNKITQILSEKCKKPIKINVILHIYAEKLIVEFPKIRKKNTIYYEDVETINYYNNNQLIIKTKNAKQFHFFGNNNENLQIIKDLVKINKN